VRGGSTYDWGCSQLQYDALLKGLGGAVKGSVAEIKASSRARAQGKMKHRFHGVLTCFGGENKTVLL